MIEVSNPRPGIRWANIVQEHGMHTLYVRLENGSTSDWLYKTERGAKLAYATQYQSKKYGFPRPKWVPCKP